MAFSYTCDGGCGTTSSIKGDFTPMGYGRPKTYCKECVETASQYLRALSDSHTRAAKQFQEDREAIRASLLEKNPKMVFPDQ